MKPLEEQNRIQLLVPDIRAYYQVWFLFAKHDYEQLSCSL